MAKVVLPRVHTMILCDEIERVLHEENVFNLLAVRAGIQAASFPYVHPQLYAYLQLTGHAGTVSGVVTAVNARTDEELFRVPTPEIQLQNPLPSCQSSFGCGMVSSPRRGYTTSRSTLIRNFFANAC
jgi:hypothetical protein